MIRNLALSALTFLPAAAQQSAHTAPTRFDVISIRRVDSVRNSSPTNIDHGSLTAYNISISRLIQAAFQIRDYQILNAPAWSDAARYDVLAKCDSATDLTARQMAPMIRSLLEDRFHFRFRQETRDLPGYTLILAKGGPKLKDSEPDRGPGTNITNYTSGKVSIDASKMSLAQLALVLDDLVKQPVVDGSGLAGAYDIKLEYDAGSNADSTVPALFTALQEQLGLRMQPKRLPVPVIVIENVEQPSGN